MSVSDITVAILKEIRDGIGALRQTQEQTNERLDVLGDRVEETNERLDETNHRLERVESGLRDLGGFMRVIARDQARNERWHVHHVRLLEKDMKELKRPRKPAQRKRRPAS